MGGMRIIIIPGWTYSTDKWTEFSGTLKKSGRKVDTLGVPGLTEPSSKIWDLKSYSLWLKEKLKNEKSVVLIGHSNGGRIAIAYAAANPGKLSRLVLIDSAGIFHNEPPLRLKRFVFRTVSKIGKGLGVSKKSGSLMYKLAGEHDYERANLNMRETMKNLIYKDLTPQMKKITTPTLIIWGEDDKVTPISDARKIKSQIKKSKLFVIKGAGHSPFYTHPREVLRILSKEL